VTRGKPWTVDEESTLRALVEANTSIDAIAVKLNKKPTPYT
jgi:sulfur carrier protein ThiS